MKPIFKYKHTILNIGTVLIAYCLSFTSCDGQKTTLKDKIEGKELPVQSDTNKTKKQSRRPSQ